MPSRPNHILPPLFKRLRTTVRQHNETAASLLILQTENTQLNPKARHMPPPSPIDIPPMSALKVNKWSAEKLRRDTRSVMRTTGMMAQEIARLEPENRVMRPKEKEKEDSEGDE